MLGLYSNVPNVSYTFAKLRRWGSPKLCNFIMAFIQYFSLAKSESLVNSFGPLLENYGMIIPKRFAHSKQLYAEFHNSNNHFSKVNLLISWVNQTQKQCSIEIWSDEPFAKDKTLCRKVHNEIIQFIKPLDFSHNTIWLKVKMYKKINLHLKENLMETNDGNGIEIKKCYEVRDFASQKQYCLSAKKIFNNF